MGQWGEPALPFSLTLHARSRHTGAQWELIDGIRSFQETTGASAKSVGRALLHPGKPRAQLGFSPPQSSWRRLPVPIFRKYSSRPSRWAERDLHRKNLRADYKRKICWRNLLTSHEAFTCGKRNGSETLRLRKRLHREGSKPVARHAHKESIPDKRNLRPRRASAWTTVSGEIPSVRSLAEIYRERNEWFL